MLKIQISANGQVTYMLSGQTEEEDIAELEALIRSEAKDLRDRKLSLETNELLSSQMTLCSLAYRSPWQPDALPVQLQYSGGVTMEEVAQLQATGA